MDIQPTPMFDMKNYKEWQVEAYLYVLLFCCHKWIGIGWEIERIVGMSQITGNIFGLPSTKNLMDKINRISMYDSDTLKTNCRLVPDELKPYLLKHALTILEIEIDDKMHSDWTKKVMHEELN